LIGCDTLTLTCTALLIVVGSEVIPSLEPLSGRAREPPARGAVDGRHHPDA